MSTMSTTLNKDAITWGQKQYHIALCPEDIGEYVLLPGDPARSDIAAKYLDNAELKANNREHRTFTGYYKGVKISVTSTGMGCPSATIAAEELIRIGAKTLIRIGSSAALDPRIKIGDLLISTGAMIGVFGSMVAQRVVPMNKNALATVLGAILMYVMIQVSKKVPALKEWNLTIAIVVAMVITALI